MTVMDEEVYEGDLDDGPDDAVGSYLRGGGHGTDLICIGCGEIVAPADAPAQWQGRCKGCAVPTTRPALETVVSVTVDRNPPGAPVLATPTAEAIAPVGETQAEEADDDKDDDPQGVGLEGKYGFAPFTVLDARAGSWQSRKKSWIRLGLASEETRDDVLGGMAAFRKDPKWAGSSIPKNLAVSVFDPVLCELAVRWFSPRASHVLDPFAGGSVRGVVTAACGRRYTGFDLRPEQVAANEAQWALLRARAGGEHPPQWWCADSRAALLGVEPKSCDLVFSCPPYADLERYSDDPADLSAMSDADFSAAYRDIIVRSCATLRDDRFAVWVIGNVRDKAGHVRDLVSETTAAFRAGGLHLYNDAILLSPVGTARLRAGQFRQTRVMPRVHQHLLIYVKGDRRKATAACGEIGGFPSLAWDAQQVGFAF